MPKLKINLGDLGGKIAEAIEAAVPNPSPFDELMARALESPNGIRLELPSNRDAVRKRFQIYKRRQILQEAGITTFDTLMIRMDDNILTVCREPEMKVVEL